LNLARIGRLELLPSLFRQVLIPAAVYEELNKSLRDLPQPLNLVLLPWLVVDSPGDRNRVQTLCEQL
jgi:predicted nucleic acid-binding protein